MERTVFFVSDRTGITAETFGRSLLTQFDDIRFHKTILRFIDTLEKADVAAGRINRAAQTTGGRAIVFSTLIDPEIRARVARSDCAFFDIMDTFIVPLEAELKTTSSHSVGRSHGLTDYNKYQKRMDALNFALATDDGMATDNYRDADIILVGVSRTGKTPACLYLALSHGIHAANYPLTSGELDAGELPPVLRNHRDKIFGLSIDPQRLHHIRTERKPDSRYASLKQCRYEVGQLEALYRREGLPFVSTTSMSIEEIATTILHQTRLQPFLT